MSCWRVGGNRPTNSSEGPEENKALSCCCSLRTRDHPSPVQTNSGNSHKWACSASHCTKDKPLPNTRQAASPDTHISCLISGAFFAVGTRIKSSPHLEQDMTLRHDGWASELWSLSKWTQTLVPPLILLVKLLGKITFLCLNFLAGK